MDTGIRILHNKKVSMTEEEYNDYQGIAQSYDRANFKGEDLFKGLFHTDDAGMITKIGIPSGHQVSMEIFLFVCALYEHQKMRMWEERVMDLLERGEKRLASLSK
jgi:hypothetical protein